jgi:hypothetical protein
MNSRSGWLFWRVALPNPSLHLGASSLPIAIQGHAEAVPKWVKSLDVV